MQFCIASLVLILAACTSTRSKIYTEIERDRISMIRQTYEKSEARQNRLAIALERIQKKEISPRFVPPSVKLHPTPAPPSSENEPVADSQDEVMHYYYSGLSEISEGNYDRAVSAFQKFVSSDPNHVYADRAQYWIAESHYRNKEYSLCILAASDFLVVFPESIKTPDILYRRALALGSLGQLSAASETLNELIRRHPNSQLAERATSHLARWKTRGA